jgi:uncharacterized protein (DUF2062 family)
MTDTPSRTTSGPLRRLFVDPLLAQLKQGATPEALANAVAAGLLAGTLPFLGLTTALAGLLGWLWKLNHPVLQAVNYALSPVQLALIVPFVRLGEKLFGAAPMPIAPTEVVRAFGESPAAALAKFGVSGLYAFVAWACCMPLLSFILSRLLRRPLRLLASRRPEGA